MKHKSLSIRQLARLEALLNRLTPEERDDLLASATLNQIAALPPDKQEALAKALAKFLHQRVQN